MDIYVSVFGCIFCLCGYLLLGSHVTVTLLVINMLKLRHTHTRTHARTHTHTHPRVDTRGGAHKKETEEKESVKVASGESRRADCDYSPDARLQLRAHKLDQRTDERPRPSAAEVTQQQGQTDDETGGVDGVAAGPNPPGAAAVDPPVRLGCGQQRH